jgi:type II secretory pathway component PulJ
LGVTLRCHGARAARHGARRPRCQGTSESEVPRAHVIEGKRRHLLVDIGLKLGRNGRVEAALHEQLLDLRLHCG